MLTFYIEALEAADLVPVCKEEIEFFTCFEKNGIKFTSKRYMKAKNTGNYFLETIQGILGVAEFYFNYNYQQYVMLETLDVLEVTQQFKKIKFNKKYLVIKANDIVERYIHIEVLKCHYIVKRPNAYERN